MQTILEKWDITAQQLTEIVNANPSLRGFMMGYVSEYKARQFFEGQSSISDLIKYDDHDRKKKGDISFTYRGREFKVEVKSLQTNTVKNLGDDLWKGTFQCDASDRRPIPLPNGHTVETTCLAVGEFDILAVNLFAFGDKWRFAYALNNVLPRSSSKKYAEEDRAHLLASSMKITWPLQDPFTLDVFKLLDSCVK